MHTALLFLLFFTLMTPVQQITLDFYWVDVEGGAATLVVTPAGESILIDTGNPGGRDADRIFKAAKDAGLTQIDYLITTHFHIDHFGGAAELAQKMPIITIYDKGIPDTLQEDAQFAARIQPYRALKSRKVLIKPGMEIKLKTTKGTPPFHLKFVGTNQQFVPVSRKATATTACDEVADKAVDKTENGNSTVLVVEYGGFRFFDGADLTWNVEKSLVCPVNLVGIVDVYQVNHHGFDQSNHPLLIKSLAPTISVMNNGVTKGCGPGTVTSLKNTLSIQAAYQVHKNLREDSQFNTADEFIANLDKDCQANYIKMVVNPDGKSYTVSIPGKGHSRTYQTKK